MSMVDSEQDSVFGNANVEFISLVQECGLSLKSKPPLLEVESPFVFRRNLGLKLGAKGSELTHAAIAFLKSLSDFVVDPHVFYNCLISISQSDRFKYKMGQQESFLRLLLGIDALQMSIVDILLQKLPEFAQDDPEFLEAHPEIKQVPRLILAQLRWLEHVQDSMVLAQKVMELVEISQFEIQREIISCLPEILDDRGSLVAVETLQPLLTSNAALTSCILDAFSNLNLSSDAVVAIRTQVIEGLQSCDVEALPVVVRFVLQSVGSTSANEVVASVREHLDFESLASMESDSADELLTLEAISSALKFQKWVGGAWLAAITNISVHTQFKAIDFFVLLMLHSVAQHKKSIENLILTKLRLGHLSEQVLSHVFQRHTKALGNFFTTLLALAEVLLRSKEDTARRFGGKIYELSFEKFETYNKQEVIGMLVTHIGSGSGSEAPRALAVLVSLFKSSPAELEQFLIFLKGVLDYLDNLSLACIRDLFHLLASICLRPQAGVGVSEHIHDLHIILRKLVSSSVEGLRRRGVVGALAVVRAYIEATLSAQTTGDIPRFNECSKQIHRDLDMLKDNTHENIAARGLFYDELSHTILASKTKDPNLFQYVDEKFLDEFQETDLRTISDLNNGVLKQLGLQRKFQLDAEEDDSLVLAATLVYYEQKGMHPDLMVALPPSVTLLQTKEKGANEGSVSEIDALLGLGVIVPSDEALEGFASQSEVSKTMMLHSLFSTINYFRECMNGFANQSDVDIQSKVLARIKHLAHLEKIVCKLLPLHPTYKPLIVHFETDAPSLAKPKGQDRFKKPTKATKDPSEEDEDAPESSAKKPSARKPTGETKEPEAINLAPFLRELDLDVHQLFRYKPCSDFTAAIAAEGNGAKALYPSQLLFLLRDLALKVRAVLLPPKIGFFASTAAPVGCTNLLQLGETQVAMYVAKLIPLLCPHLESLYAFFSHIIAENAGQNDVTLFEKVAEYRPLVDSFDLTMEIFTLLFNWEGFNYEENKHVLRLVFKALALRTTPGSQRPFGEVCKDAYQYLLRFGEVLPVSSSMGAHLTLLSAVCARAEANVGKTLRGHLAHLAFKCLQRSWSNDLKKPIKPVHLSIALNAYLENSEDSIGCVIEVLKNLEALFADTPQQEEVLATMSQGTALVFLKAALHKLTSTVSTLNIHQATGINVAAECETLAEGEESPIIEEHLGHIESCCKAFGGFGLLCKQAQASLKSVLGVLVRLSRPFIDAFIRSCLPILDKVFLHHYDKVIATLESLQKSTRYLQHVCNYSKAAKDLTLTAFVPALKKSLETLIFKMKIILGKHHAGNAFSVGNLKNRALDGTTLSSQVPHDEEEEEAPKKRPSKKKTLKSEDVPSKSRKKRSAPKQEQPMEDEGEVKGEQEEDDVGKRDARQESSESNAEEENENVENEEEDEEEEEEEEEQMKLISSSKSSKRKKKPSRKAQTIQSDDEAEEDDEEDEDESRQKGGKNEKEEEEEAEDDGEEQEEEDDEEENESERDAVGEDHKAEKEDNDGGDDDDEAPVFKRKAGGAASAAAKQSRKVRRIQDDDEEDSENVAPNFSESEGPSLFASGDED